MKRFTSIDFKTLIISGGVTFGFVFLIVRLSYVILDSNDISKPIFVVGNILGLLLVWSFLYLLIDKYPTYKVLGVVGTLVIAILAERLIDVGNNPITIPLIILFWLGLVYFILPQFFKKYQTAILLVYGLVIAYYLFSFITAATYGQEDRASFARFMLMPIPVFGILWLYEQWKWVKVLKEDRTKAELTLLKSQVNPHFFFNTLNNLYGLVVEKSPKAPEVVLLLSDMMRYTIDVGKEDVVSLKEEVNYLETYISLHKMRYQKKVDIKFEHNIDKDVQVAPLLFINLLENAFKHGVGTLTENAFIHLTLSTNGNEVLFSITNNYDANVPSKRQGGGLDNLKKRLLHGYPNRHEFKIKKTDNTYTVHLNLSLNPSIFK